MNAEKLLQELGEVIKADPECGKKEVVFVTTNGYILDIERVGIPSDLEVKEKASNVQGYIGVEDK